MLAYRSQMELRQKLEQAAIHHQDIVKAVDEAYGITMAMTCGSAPKIPGSVSAMHYSSHTKFDETHAEVEWYSLRDGCQYLMHWIGPCDSVFWQYLALYCGITTFIDDFCLPPFELEAGTFLYHGLTLRNIIDKICQTGPEGAATWRSYLWNASMRAAWLQYLEKVGAKIAETTPQASNADLLKHCQSTGEVIQAIHTRTATGFLQGVLATLLAARGVARDDVCDCVIEDTSLGHTTLFDMIKDQQGIIMHDVTNTLAGRRGDTEVDFRRLALRQTFYAQVQTSAVNPVAAEVCEAYLYSSPLYTRFMDRYRSAP
ncbi:hypothetical protein EC968_001659 [Mortierella alpina]|nr:hypothetical protein EC968_001659 [Mortierella alpina]